MDLTHFEEGYHEGLFVVRAISAHQACCTGVDVEPLNANQSRRLLIPGNLSLVPTHFSDSSYLLQANKDEGEGRSQASPSSLGSKDTHIQPRSSGNSSSPVFTCLTHPHSQFLSNPIPPSSVR
jgi:hypothetical protein